MNLKEYKEISQKLCLNSIITSTPSLINLNHIASAALYTFPYSDLSIHAPHAPETELSWATIFARLVCRSLPGCCYERGEVLYQLLNYLNYDVVRLEVRCVSRGRASQWRHEHMALGIRLNDEWYLVDTAWAQVFTGNAVKLKHGHITETPRMMIRTVHSNTRGEEKNVKSNLEPSLMRQWDVEYLVPHLDADDDNIKQHADQWKVVFTVDFERQQLEDFKHQCHRMHHDENQFCKLNSLLAWNDFVCYKGTIYPRHTMIQGYEQVETIFITSLQHVKRFKVYDTVRQINEVCVKHNVKIEYENWKPRSSVSVQKYHHNDQSN